MSYFIAMRSPTDEYGWTASSRTIYPTHPEAEQALALLQLNVLGEFKVMDADHDPGKTIVRRRRGIA